MSEDHGSSRDHEPEIGSALDWGGFFYGAPDASDARMMMELLASIWFYGGFEAETTNEKLLQYVMERRGWWPIENEEQLLRLINSSAKPNPDAVPGMNTETVLKDGVEWEPGQ